jgi:hypothetical protein
MKKEWSVITPSSTPCISDTERSSWARTRKQPMGERYVCCYAERVMFYEQYLEAKVSDDFAEIVKLYGERVTQAADEIMKETEKVTSEIGMNDEITAKDCKPISQDDAIEIKSS